MKKILFIALIMSLISISASAQTTIKVNGELDNTGYLIRWEMTTDIDRFYCILYGVSNKGPKNQRIPFLLTWTTTKYGMFYLPVTTDYDFFLVVRLDNENDDIVYVREIKNKEIKRVDDILEY